MCKGPPLLSVPELKYLMWCLLGITSSGFPATYFSHMFVAFLVCYSPCFVHGYHPIHIKMGHRKSSLQDSSNLGRASPTKSFIETASATSETIHSPSKLMIFYSVTLHAWGPTIAARLRPMCSEWKSSICKAELE